MNAVNTVKNYNNNDTDRLDSIMLYLHENYQKRITLSEVAKLTNMSDASLMRFLKKWTGNLKYVTGAVLIIYRISTGYSNGVGGVPLQSTGKNIPVRGL